VCHGAQWLLLTYLGAHSPSPGTHKHDRKDDPPVVNIQIVVCLALYMMRVPQSVAPLGDTAWCAALVSTLPGSVAGMQLY
jgi:hypothetical protein